MSILSTKGISSLTGVAALMALLAAATPSANGALVSGWGWEVGAGSSGAQVLTETGPGTFSTSGLTGNSAPRALIDSATGLNDNSGFTVAVGETITFSGNFTTTSTNLGNIQFRVFLGNTNGHTSGTLVGDDWTGADPAGWLGYMMEAPNNNSVGAAMVGRDGLSGSWFSNTGTYAITETGTQTGSAGGAGTYSFSLSLTRDTASSVTGVFSLSNVASGGTYDMQGTFTDSGASASLTSYNAVGFLANGVGADPTFSNLDVTVVPEPSSAALAAVGAVGLLAFRQRRRA
jgi:MYXO-CTERM domain-containing protein